MDGTRATSVEGHEEEGLSVLSASTSVANRAVLAYADAGQFSVATYRYRRSKRAFDIAVALTGIVVLSPFFLGVAATVALTDGFPVVFRQKRLRQGCGVFDCYKFRSMYKDAEAVLHRHPELLRQHGERFKLDNDPRVTRVGKFIRAASLDELPQLLNVLLGEMSIVGPRPIVPAELVKYGDHAGAFVCLKPGLTGLWQISGRSDTTYEERIQLDLEYCRRASLLLDCWIVCKTFRVVLSRKGAR